MDEITTVQGRKITKDDIELVRWLIEANSCWNRTRLSQELCLDCFYCLRLEHSQTGTCPVGWRCISSGALQVSAFPVSLSGFQWHGGREHEVSDFWPEAQSPGLPSLWLGSLEVCPPGWLYRLGCSYKGSKSQILDQQHAVFDFALGQSSAPVKDIYLYPLTKRFREALSQQVGEQKGRRVEDDK